MSKKSTQQNQAVHFILQGKGGVGKSTAASCLAQFLARKYGTVAAYDTDPVNRTLAGFKALQATEVELMNGSNLDTRNFDYLIEQIISTDPSVPIVVDNGASSFIPLTSYLHENDIFALLREHGRDVVLHTVVTGGQAAEDTARGLIELVKFEQSIVVWANEFFGKIEINGKELHDWKPLKMAEEKGFLSGVVTLEARNKDTFGHDFELLLQKRMTFDEAKNSPIFGLLAKSRLAKIQNELFVQLDAIL